MRLPVAFGPIEPGEIDTFAFDFTPNIGAATISSTTWTCSLASFQTAIDPTPQSRILSVSIQTTLQVRSPIDGSLQTLNGFFSVASIGTMPVSANGGTYVLESTVNLSDGRILKLNSTLLCTQLAG